MFKSIQINKWRQFGEVDITFHDRLTILTGANGSGKTTILNIFNSHFGWPIQFVGTPKQSSITGDFKFFSDIWSSILDVEKESVPKQHEIGKIVYRNGNICAIHVPYFGSPIYNVGFSNLHHVRGFHIPSHRSLYKYQPIQKIPSHLISREFAFNQFNNSYMNRYLGNSSGPTDNYYIKESLISFATFGYGNKVIIKNDEAIKLFEGFEKILKKVLPPKLGFQRFEIRMPEVVLVTTSGDFSLDAVSGGIASIIDLAWRIFMFDDSLEPFTVTFDEPENHLHPEMQKTLLPNFLSAFPRTQFIVATHNPFIISSVSDSNVYILNYNNSNRVVSMLLKDIEKSGSANDILRDILGIETTMPDWVGVKLESIISKYTQTGITAVNLNSFKEELKSIGLEKYVPTTIANLIEKTKKND